MARSRKKDRQSNDVEAMPEAADQRPQGTAEFEFDLAGPLFTQMKEKLDTVVPVELTEENIDKVPHRPGLYVLHRNSKPIYVGKSDGAITARLRKYRRILSGRKGIKLEEISFRCITFAKTWDPFKPEEQLMKVLDTSRSPGWNGTGIGSNEEGKKRKTALKETSFHKRFPLNEAWLCKTIKAGKWGALPLLRAIKNEVPFFFKFQGNRDTGDDESREQGKDARQDYEQTVITVPSDSMSAKELLILIARNLPGEWQATITPSHMFLYKEKGGKYPDGEIVWPARS